jgi:hypothetical protein
MSLISKRLGGIYAPNFFIAMLLPRLKIKKGLSFVITLVITLFQNITLFFNAYVPTKFIQQILQQAHADPVFGLSVPAMPTSAMDIGDKVRPYQV